MSDNKQLRSPSALADIQHLKFLSDNLRTLLENPIHSDVTLKVENCLFPVHKIIIASQSDYFRALLYGGLHESLPETREIELKEIRAVPFRAILRYIYCGCIDLSELKEEDILELLCLAHQYTVPNLVKSLYEYLKSSINLHNICPIYDIGLLFSHDPLVVACENFIDTNAENVITTDGFLQLSEAAMFNVVSRNSFCAAEADIFRAVCRWYENNPGVDIKKIVNAIRLPLMSQDSLFEIVRPSGLVEANAILDALEVQLKGRYSQLHHRGVLLPDENQATIAHGAQVIRGEIRVALLDGNTENYDLDRGFTRHPIDDNNGQGIVVKLGRPAIINSIRMLLWDKDPRSYSYYIEVSIDDDMYTRVIDHGQYLCRSWQILQFDPVVARYIRVVGTHNTVNRVFHLVTFECLYSTKSFKTENGLIVPLENVATLNRCASVIEGVSRVRNALINGDFVNYDWDSGYTCHQLNSGCIMVQLAQPYFVDSIRMLLWDCDDRRYSYFVEASVDGHHWELLADCRHILCRSWQTILFKKRPIVFVKIVGTHNTANEVFHVVHFEIPAVLAPEINKIRDSESTNHEETLLFQNNDAATMEQVPSGTSISVGGIGGGGGGGNSVDGNNGSNNNGNNINNNNNNNNIFNNNINNFMLNHNPANNALLLQQQMQQGIVLPAAGVQQPVMHGQQQPLVAGHQVLLQQNNLNNNNNNNNNQGMANHDNVNLFAARAGGPGGAGGGMFAGGRASGSNNGEISGAGSSSNASNASGGNSGNLP